MNKFGPLNGVHQHIGKRVALVLIILLALIASPVLAQEDEPLCTPGDLSAAAEHSTALLTQALDAPDAVIALDLLTEARMVLLAAQQSCYGLDFEGTVATVYDPITIPAGLYRVTATTPGFFQLMGTILDGSCDEEYAYYNLSRDEATTGAQITFNSQGCTMLWETANISAPYAVTFEKLR